jgi:hypothetical protein
MYPIILGNSDTLLKLKFKISEGFGCKDILTEHARIFLQSFYQCILSLYGICNVNQFY